MQTERIPSTRAVLSARVILLILLMVLPTACGRADQNADQITPRDAASGSGAAMTTDLTITSDDGSGNTQVWTLTCDPIGGTHPDPDTACATLAQKGESALPPVPKDQMCTQIYGGPQTAHITGTWNGKPVDATFSRRNGCEISRWQALEGLLPKASAASAR